MLQYNLLFPHQIRGAKKHTAMLAIASTLILNSILVQAAKQSFTHNVRGTTTTAASSSTTVNATSCAPAPTSSLVVNVRDKGAKGDGITDDTAAIQAAVNQVGGTGGTVLIPDGTYLINGISDGWDGISLKGNMTLQLSSGATLQEIPNSHADSSVITVQNVSNVNIIGGTVQGERAGHLGTTGESGMGINILASNNIVVDGVTTKEARGDGIYIGGSTIPSKNITVCNLVSDNNYRQGLSVTSADGVVIRDSIFKNSNGTLPEAGIDIEPDSNAFYVRNIQILNSQFMNNAGEQILVYAGDSLQGIKPVTGIIIDGNDIYSDKAGMPLSDNIGIAVTNLDNVKITNNYITTNNYAIEFNRSTGNIVTGNTSTASAFKPAVIGDDGGNIITGDNVFP